MPFATLIPSHYGRNGLESRAAQPLPRPHEEDPLISTNSTSQPDPARASSKVPSVLLEHSSFVITWSVDTHCRDIRLIGYFYIRGEPLIGLLLLYSPLQTLPLPSS